MVLELLENSLFQVFKVLIYTRAVMVRLWRLVETTLEARILIQRVSRGASIEPVVVCGYAQDGNNERSYVKTGESDQA
jgi:hypothetical protein